MDPESNRPPRKNNPAYHVFMHVLGQPDAPGGKPATHWHQLTPEKEPVSAGSRKQAVEQVLSDIGKLDEKGPFLVVPVKECWVKTKRTETTKTEVWS